MSYRVNGDTELARRPLESLTPEERNKRRLTVEPVYNNLEDKWMKNLWNPYQVDQAIMEEPERLVVIRFGSHDDIECQVQDHALASMFPSPSLDSHHH